jgi:hypothetical protein
MVEYKSIGSVIRDARGNLIKLVTRYCTLLHRPAADYILASRRIMHFLGYKTLAEVRALDPSAA